MITVCSKKTFKNYGCKIALFSVRDEGRGCSVSEKKLTWKEGGKFSVDSHFFYHTPPLFITVATIRHAPVRHRTVQAPRQPSTAAGSMWREMGQRASPPPTDGGVVAVCERARNLVRRREGDGCVARGGEMAKVTRTAQ